MNVGGNAVDTATDFLGLGGGSDDAGETDGSTSQNAIVNIGGGLSEFVGTVTSNQNVDFSQ